MKIRTYTSKKVTAIVLSLLIITGGLIKQYHKNYNFKKSLSSQTRISECAYSDTNIDIDSLKYKLNGMKQYKILDGKINVKHKYTNQRDSIFGLKSHYTLVGTADFYYEYIINFKDIKIRNDFDKIYLEINRAKLNSETCHRVSDTFVRMDEECSDNILTSKLDVETTTRDWEDSFDTKCIQMIEDYYRTSDMQLQLDTITVEQIESLLVEFGYSKDDINIVIR